MEGKKLVKTMKKYRIDLALKAPESVVSQFDQFCRSDKKISAIKLLREYGIIKSNQPG